MKNGCNFHALQVKSNYKNFSEKIEPKKDACRMAIKIKGKLPLKICSVLFVLYGAASLVALLLCLIDRKYVEEYDLSAYFNSSMPVLSVAGAMLVPVLLLIAGLMGHAPCRPPEQHEAVLFSGPCYRRHHSFQCFVRDFHRRCAEYAGNLHLCSRPRSPRSLHVLRMAELEAQGRRHAESRRCRPRTRF